MITQLLVLQNTLFHDRAQIPINNPPPPRGQGPQVPPINPARQHPQNYSLQANGSRDNRPIDSPFIVQNSARDDSTNTGADEHAETSSEEGSGQYYTAEEESQSSSDEFHDALTPSQQEIFPDEPSIGTTPSGTLPDTPSSIGTTPSDTTPADTPPGTPSVGTPPGTPSFGSPGVVQSSPKHASTKFPDKLPPGMLRIPTGKQPTGKQPTGTMQPPAHPPLKTYPPTPLPICLYINSSGGSYEAGMAIYDIMTSIQKTTHIATICLGRAYGISSLLLAKGSRGMRVASANSRAMIKQSMTRTVSTSSAKCW